MPGKRQREEEEDQHSEEEVEEKTTQDDEEETEEKGDQSEEPEQKQRKLMRMSCFDKAGFKKTCEDQNLEYAIDEQALEEFEHVCNAAVGKLLGAVKRVVQGKEDKTITLEDVKKAAQSAVPGRQTAPGDWECPACHVSNFASRSVCFKCGANAPEGMGGQGFRGGRGGRGGFQRGGRGGRGGFGDRGGRGGFGQRGGRGGRGGFGQRAPDWKCQACGTEGNFGSKSNCFKCGAPKE